MTRYFGIAITVVLIVVVLAAAGVTYAQTLTPQPGQPEAGYGPGTMMSRRGGIMGGQGGMMGRGQQNGQGRGQLGGMMNRANGDFGLMHAEMVKTFAAGLGLTVDEINARIAGGETLWQIAQSKGQTAEQFTALMTSARTTALAELVRQGTLTQEQADWMQSHSAQMPRWGLDGSGPVDCPMLDGDESGS